jgi:23S rRNA (adenine2503-C2)-methyltransferase
MIKENLFNCSKSNILSFFEEKELDTFRSTQVWQWMYQRGIREFQKMHNLGNKVANLLEENFSLAIPEISKELISSDGTRKWLLKLADNNEIETVFIPEKHRGTLCISSQVGCTLTCKFCHTGTQRLVRNLTAGEIITQLIYAKDQLLDWHQPTDKRIVTNVVLMGMGEPLLNYENVKQAINIFTDAKGLNISKNKITLSTSGIVPYIDQCAAELGVNLAVSLHATTDELRNEIVPINKKYPINKLLEACLNYSERTKEKRITFEYVMLEGINDTEDDARRLIKLISGIPAKINIIPFNPWPGSPYKCSSNSTIKKFATIIEKAGYKSPVRTPRGLDIMAACGQLKSSSERAPQRNISMI